MDNSSPLFYKIKTEPIDTEDHIEEEQDETEAEFEDVEINYKIEPQFCLLETTVASIENENTKSRKKLDMNVRPKTNRNSHLNVKKKVAGTSKLNLKPKGKRKNIKPSKTRARKTAKKTPVLLQPIIIEEPKRQDCNKNKFPCNICGKSLSTRNILNRHKRIVHLNKTATCELCNKTFKSKTYLSVHKYKMHSNKTFNCAHCSYSSGNKIYMVDHLKTNHLYIRRYRSKPSKYYADLNKLVKSKFLSLNHSNKSKNGSESLNISETANISENRLQYENKSKFSNVSESENRSEISNVSESKNRSEFSNVSESEKRSEISNVSESVNQSNYTKTSENNSKCSNETKNNETEFLNTSESLIGPQTCGICNRVYQKICYLVNHQKLVHSHITKDNINTTLLFSCDICGDLLEDYKKFLAHKRKKHCSEIMCILCNKSFSAKYYLGMHNRRIHNKYNIYCCAHCTYAAHTKEYLVQHIKRKHLNTRVVHYCEKCKKKFYSFEKLTDHYIQKHKDNISDVYRIIRNEEAKTESFAN